MAHSVKTVVAAAGGRPPPETKGGAAPAGSRPVEEIPFRRSARYQAWPAELSTFSFLCL